MAPNYPIVNAGLLYVNGLELDYLVIPSVPVSSYAAGKAIIMQPGQARDSLNINDMVLPQAVDVNGNPYFLNNFPVGAVINGLQVGAPNGVDVAVLAASSLYSVYVIGSSRSVFTPADELSNPPGLDAPANPFPVAGLLSLASNAAPFLPFGYDMYRLIGAAATDSSANVALLSQYSNGDGSVATYSFAPVRVLTAGPATTFTAVALNVGIAPTAGVPAVPANASEVILSVSYTSALAANTAQFLPFGSALAGGSVGIVSFGGGVAGLQTGVISVPVGVDGSVHASIGYKVVSGDSLTLSVVGYR